MILFPRKKPPGGKPGGEPSEEYCNGMQAMERWYHDLILWAASYIYLLEKQIASLKDAEEDRCGQGKDSDDKD